MPNNTIHQNLQQDQYLDVKKVIELLKKHWYFFVIAQAAFLLAAFMVGKVIAPVYEVSSSIYVKEQGALEGAKAMEFMQSFQLFDQKRTFQNEMLVLQSTPLVEEAVNVLGLEISYYEKDGFLFEEVYKASPFEVLYDSTHMQAADVPFTIEFSEDGKFTIEAESDEFRVVDYAKGTSFKSRQLCNVSGDFFQTDGVESEWFKFRVILKDAGDLQRIAGTTFRFVFHDKQKVVQEYQKNLTVAPVNPEVSVVGISLKASNYNKGIDFVSALTNLYLQKNLARKNHFAQNTIAYINRQLNEISDSLDIAESRLEEFRAGNQVIDISSKAGRIFERLHQLELEKSTIERQYQYYQYLDEFFEANDDLADLVVPSSMGITDQTLNELMKDLILLVNQRNELIGKKQEKSPFLRNLEVQIESLKRPIVENINFSLSTLDRTIADLTKKINEMKGNIEALPKTERQLVGFERKYQLNDAIYTFLLQRRAEAQIARASNLPEHEVVEPARLISRLYPNNLINYGFAGLMGFLIPGLLIVAIRFLDDRVKDEQAFGAYAHLPFLGAVIKKQTDADEVVGSHPNSAISETFRTIRTNLFFLLKGGESKVLLVTSSISGEGKSFVSLNLALSLSQMGKKVVLVGYDLRKSRQFIDLVDNAELGLTSYYVGQKKVNDIIQSSKFENLDVITAGVVPPNPMELIANESTKRVFDELKSRYDFIILDSSPIGVVSDAYLLMEHADVSLFVVRENFSHKTVMSTVLDELTAKTNGHLGIVLNASRMEGKKYRYEYYNKYTGKDAALT